MANEKRVSIKDVANSIGVSTTLVSIVLNGKAKQYRIADEMAEKVIKTAMEMNYSPNLIARNLRGGKTQLIGLIVTDISNPFYSSIARIVENRANELGYTVIFSSSDEDLKTTKKLIDVLLSKGVDGLLIVPCDGSEEVMTELHNNNTPLVLIDRNFPKSDISFSCLNNFKATELTTQHLIDQGYENIALIGYKTEMNHILDRISGYETTMQAAGLERFIQVEKVNLSNTQVEMNNVLDTLVSKKKTEAVIFLTNMLAVSGLYCLKEMAIKIPDDIAVVGFNRNDVFNLFYSPITHIKQPLEQIASQAVDILINKINHSELETKTMVFSEPQLIIGESSINRNKS
ncbi:MAG: LacI family transcriptional regulator [Paludibacter sp.]|nr:LacI family transcriptional regulator [Paludibacter sp.]